MNAIREILDSSVFKNIIFLPEDFKNRKVEVIILPVESNNEQKNAFNPKDFIGTLNIDNVEDVIKNIRNEWNEY